MKVIESVVKWLLFSIGLIIFLSIFFSLVSDWNNRRNTRNTAQFIYKRMNELKTLDSIFNDKKLYVKACDGYGRVQFIYKKRRVYGGACRSKMKKGAVEPETLKEIFPDYKKRIEEGYEIHFITMYDYTYVSLIKVKVSEELEIIEISQPEYEQRS